MVRRQFERNGRNPHFGRRVRKPIGQAAEPRGGQVGARLIREVFMYHLSGDQLLQLSVESVRVTTGVAEKTHAMRQPVRSISADWRLETFVVECAPVAGWTQHTHL